MNIHGVRNISMSVTKAVNPIISFNVSNHNSSWSQLIYRRNLLSKSLVEDHRTQQTRKYNVKFIHIYVKSSDQ